MSAQMYPAPAADAPLVVFDFDHTLYDGDSGSHLFKWLIERDCARLKGRALSIRPVWVSREDHAVGLTHLLTLGARVLALVEYQARLKLQQAGRTLTGLFAGQPKRATDQPTTERLLKAFDRIILTTIQTGRHVQQVPHRAERREGSRPEPLGNRQQALERRPFRLNPGPQRGDIA